MNFEELIGNMISHPLLREALTTVAAIVIIFMLARFARALSARKIEDKILRYNTIKAISMAGYVLTLIAAVVIFSDQLTNLTVIIDALSVGIGFALRELIQSLIGWSIISFGGVIQAGGADTGGQHHGRCD